MMLFYCNFFGLNGDVKINAIEETLEFMVFEKLMNDEKDD